MTREILAKRVGELLRRARLAVGLSPDQLRAKAKDRTLSRSILSRYEHGQVLPTLDRLKSLMAACDDVVPPDLCAAIMMLAQEEPHMRQIESEWEKFVRAWQSSDCIADVAEKLGTTKLKVSVKAAYARKQGVPLKKMFHGRSGTVDWASLVDLAKDLSRQKEAGGNA